MPPGGSDVDVEGKRAKAERNGRRGVAEKKVVLKNETSAEASRVSGVIVAHLSSLSDATGTRCKDFIRPLLNLSPVMVPGSSSSQWEKTT